VFREKSDLVAQSAFPGGVGGSSGPPGMWGVPAPTLCAESTPSIKVELCSQPCWYGIIPGKTSAEEALSILKAIPGVREVRSNIFGTGEKRYGEIEWTTGRPKTWWYTPRSTRTYNHMKVEKGVVVAIGIELSLSETLTLGEVVERYGPPEWYETFYVRGYHADEADKWSVYLDYYPRMGLSVGVNAPAERYGDVTADLEVTIFGLSTLEETARFYKEWEDYYRSLGTNPYRCRKKWQGFHRGEKPCPVP